MRRPFLVVLLFLLVSTTLITTLAFRSAQPNSAASVTVASTDVAQLAVVQVDTSIATYSNGQLTLNFPSQQPNSTYTYNSVFKVINRTPATIAFSVSSVTGETSPGAHLTITDSADGTVYWSGGVASNSKNMTSMAEVSLNVSVTLDSGVTTGAPQSLSVTVKGQ